MNNNKQKGEKWEKGNKEQMGQIETNNKMMDSNLVI